MHMAREELLPGWLPLDPVEETELSAHGDAFSEEDAPEPFIASVGDLPGDADAFDDGFDFAVASF
ncbi:hypothetical protein D7Y13_30115 [Corallococcus praedator]|uniref:Uncharacterized protein n=2 Tax=Myxococcaceae TaxID=31 RepID=A0ABX9QCI7_9BACT|nr:hypothetical protein D7X75_34525 [Corallococcus sp. CA031C]RKH97272.1 hypothetical protein D7Y13_30115 [Corallococcus praedator]